MEIQAAYPEEEVYARDEEQTERTREDPADRLRLEAEGLVTSRREANRSDRIEAATTTTPGKGEGFTATKLSNAHLSLNLLTNSPAH